MFGRRAKGRAKNEESNFAVDSVLSELYFAAETAFLPVYTNVLGVCCNCCRKIWSLSRRLDGNKAYSALPSFS